MGGLVRNRQNKVIVQIRLGRYREYFGLVSILVFVGIVEIYITKTKKVYPYLI